MRALRSDRADEFLPAVGLESGDRTALLSIRRTAPVLHAVAPLVSAGGGLSTACDPTTLTGCVPFSDMDANYSNGSSVYHGLTANLKKRFGDHYEFLASYTWSHAIDDSTDLQSPLAPQDSYFPGAGAFDVVVRPASSPGVQRRVSERKAFRSGLCQQLLQQLDFRADP